MSQTGTLNHQRGRCETSVASGSRRNKRLHRSAALDVSGHSVQNSGLTMDTRSEPARAALDPRIRCGWFCPRRRLSRGRRARGCTASPVHRGWRLPFLPSAAIGTSKSTISRRIDRDCGFRHGRSRGRLRHHAGVPHALSGSRRRLDRDCRRALQAHRTPSSVFRAQCGRVGFACPCQSGARRGLGLVGGPRCSRDCDFRCLTAHPTTDHLTQQTYPTRNVPCNGRAHGENHSRSCHTFARSVGETGSR